MFGRDVDLGFANSLELWMSLIIIIHNKIRTKSQ